MDLSNVSVDPVKVEQGEWVGNIPQMGDLRLRIRGAENADWRRLQSKLIAAIPRQLRIGGQIDPDEADRITSVLLRDAALLDWENLSEDGKPLAYSKENADRLLTDPTYRRFRDAALWASQNVGERVAVQTGDLVKNSTGASPGT